MHKIKKERERIMGDLHSIAFSSSCKVQRSSLGLAWDLHNLGVFKADMSQCNVNHSISITHCLYTTFPFSSSPPTFAFLSSLVTL